MSKSRPKLTKRIGAKTFRMYYWLKTELIAFCSENGLSTLGLKTEVANRIETFIKAGIKKKQVTAVYQ